MKRLNYYWIYIMILPAIIILAGEVYAGHITGSVMSLDGEPVTQGTVLFFSETLGPAPDKSRYMRTPEIVSQTDGQGNFSAELPEGKYYIGALKRLSGKWGGPPREGDMFFISKEVDGSPRVYAVSMDAPLDIGSITEPEPVETVSSAGEITALEGIIYDMHGNPLEDVVVFAYAGPIVDQGLSFVSGYTLADGKYVLRVPKGGKYNLMIMGKFGSAFPGTGMTITDEGEQISENLLISTGEINSNVDIRMTNE